MRARIHRFVPGARFADARFAGAHHAGLRLDGPGLDGPDHAAAGHADAHHAAADHACPGHAPGSAEHSTPRGDLLLDRLVSAALEISLALALTLLPSLAARFLGETSFLATWLPLAGLGWVLSRPAVWRWGGATEVPDAPRVLRAFGASRF